MASILCVLNSLPNVSGTLVSTGDTGSVTSAMIADGAIVNADINAGAEIAVSKLANGTARQLLQTDSGGSGVEFTSNVDVPGTLDVTSAATFDSTVAVTTLSDLSTLPGANKCLFGPMVAFHVRAIARSSVGACDT